MATGYAAVADGAAARPHGRRLEEAVTQRSAEQCYHDEPGEADRARAYRAELVRPAEAVLQPGATPDSVAYPHEDPPPEMAIGHEQTAATPAGSCPAAG